MDSKQDGQQLALDHNLMDCKKHIAVIEFTPELLVQFATGNMQDGIYRFDAGVNPIPKDVKIVGKYYDHKKDCFGVILEHPDFNPVHLPYELIPYIRSGNVSFEPLPETSTEE